MKLKLLTTIVVLGLIVVVFMRSRDGSANAKSQNLEIRIIDAVLIDPRTGKPPTGVTYEIIPPEVGFNPILIESPLGENRPDHFHFRVTWISESDQQQSIQVNVEGYEPLEIGMNKIKRCSAVGALGGRYGDKIELTPLNVEQAVDPNA